MSWASRRWGPSLEARYRTRAQPDDFIGGARRDRTADLLHAMQALSQLSYGPTRGRRNLRRGLGLVKRGRGARHRSARLSRQARQRLGPLRRSRRWLISGVRTASGNRATAGTRALNTSRARFNALVTEAQYVNHSTDSDAPPDSDTPPSTNTTPSAFGRQRDRGACRHARIRLRRHSTQAQTTGLRQHLGRLLTPCPVACPARQLSCAPPGRSLCCLL
jgi:hypothetical protein